MFATFAAIALLSTDIPDLGAASATPVTSIPIDGAFVHPGAALDAATRQRVPRASVHAIDHSGIDHIYAGARLADVMRDAGAPIGKAVRGDAARAYLLVSASDGYSALFSLGEIDTAATQCAPIASYAIDGAPSSAANGSVQIVAPCDGSHARWIHGVIKLTIVVAEP